MMAGSSTSTRTTIINGVRQSTTTIRKTLPDGNVSVETITDDGQGNVQRQRTVMPASETRHIQNF